jgi:hypothetical protein
MNKKEERVALAIPQEALVPVPGAETAGAQGKTALMAMRQVGMKANVAVGKGVKAKVTIGQAALAPVAAVVVVVAVS